MILGLILIAINIKITQQQKRSSYAKVPDEIKLTPFSKALAELVAIAGGVYISLLMLTSFLSLSIPEEVKLTENLQVDPLAMLAVIITLAQPIIVKFLKVDF